MKILLALLLAIPAHGQMLQSIVNAQAPPAVGSTFNITTSVCTHTNPSAATDTCTPAANTTIGDLAIYISKSGATSVTGTLAITFSGTAPCTPSTIVGTVFQTNGSGKFVKAIRGCIVTAASGAAAIATWTGAGINTTYTDIEVFTIHKSTAWSVTFVDQVASNAAASSTTSCPTGTTATTTGTDDFVLATCDVFNNSQTQGAMAGFTAITTASTSSSLSYWQATTSTGAKSATVPLSAADFGLGMIAVLK